MITDSELTISAREMARSLSYNDEKESIIKHTLLELAHRIDTNDIRIHKKKDGYLILNGLGKSRFLNYKETFLYKVFNVIPKKI